MAKATWNNRVIAESSETIEIEGNQYFPPSSVDMGNLKKSAKQYMCPWKGEAKYYDIEVEGEVLNGGAWSYLVPKEGSVERVGKNFAGYIAFEDGVEVT